MCVCTHTHLMALCPGLPGWAGTRKVKAIWILLKQETLSGGGISWAICKSAPRSRQITMPATHHLVSYRPDALPAAQPTASKHWKYISITQLSQITNFWAANDSCKDSTLTISKLTFTYSFCTASVHWCSRSASRSRQTTTQTRLTNIYCINTRFKITGSNLFRKRGH